MVWITLGCVIHSGQCEVGLPLVELCVNILLGLFLLLISVTSASTSNSSSELELYLSSVKRGTDNCDKCEPEFDDVGRGIWGVNGLCCTECGTGTGVSVILTVSACGGVGLGLFSWPICPSAVKGLVADCMDVGLGG